jgi:hypothetical protein
MIKLKSEYIQVRCTEQQKKDIKSLAEGKGLSVSDFILTELLNLKVVEKDVISEYPVGKKYNRRYISTKKVLVPKEDWRKAEEEDRLNSEMASSLSVALLKSSGNFE